jgi:hypothetical protein
MSASVPFVEVRDLAHEIVDAGEPARHRAQEPVEQRGRRAGPQKQREMREVAALGKDADQFVHGLVIPEAERSEAVRNP